MVSFLYGVAESLQRTGDAERLKAAAFHEAENFLRDKYLEALEKLFELRDRGAQETELKEVLDKANREDPSADDLAAAAYLRAVYLDRRRRAEDEQLSGSAHGS